MAGATDLDDAVIVAAGSNLAGDYGSSEDLLEAALARLAQAGLPIVGRSSWWASAAWPDPMQPEYRNGVVVVEAAQGPDALIQTLFGIEAEFARKRGETNAARTLDLDLIAYGRRVIDQPGLIVPHPRAHDRLFVMGPLAQIAPRWRHPVLGRTAVELAAEARTGTDAHPT